MHLLGIPGPMARKQKKRRHYETGYSWDYDTLRANTTLLEFCCDSHVTVDTIHVGRIVVVEHPQVILAHLLKQITRLLVVDVSPFYIP